MYSFHELADIVQNEIKNLKYPQQPELLYAPIVYSLEEGGKRIRPVALLMPCIRAGTTTWRSCPATQ